MKTRGIKPGSSSARGERVETPDGPGEALALWRPQRGYLLGHRGPPPLYVVVLLDTGKRGLYSAELVEREPDPEGDAA